MLEDKSGKAESSVAEVWRKPWAAAALAHSPLTSTPGDRGGLDREWLLLSLRGGQRRMRKRDSKANVKWLTTGVV